MGERSEANPEPNNKEEGKHRQVVADFLQRSPKQGWASKAKPIPTFQTQRENPQHYKGRNRQSGFRNLQG